MLQLGIRGLGIARFKFNPLSWFLKGEPGAWYDPSDLTTLFQDSAGTTPVTAVEQPVGLMLDKSKGLALGAELVANGGPFTNTTGWVSRANCTLAVVGIELIGTGTTSGSVYRFYYQPVTVIGYTYKVTVNITSLAGTGDMLTVYSSAGAGQIASISIPTTGIYTIYFTATTTTTCIEFGDINSTSPKYTGISNISVKQIAGNHAFQATAGNRPTLSARTNLLLATTTLATQSVTSSATNYTLAFTGAGTVTLSGTATGVLSAGSNTFTATAGTLTLTVSGSVTLADLRPTNSGALLPPYQRVNTASDYDTVGFPLYLKANGTSSSMSTNSIDFTATDKMTVVTGVRKLSEPSAAPQAIVDMFDGNLTHNTFTLGVLSTSLGLGNGYESLIIGASTFGTTYAIGFTSPISNVVTFTLDRSKTTQLTADNIRVNSNIPTLNSGGPGLPTASNFGNYPLYLLARGGTSNFLNGQFYGAIIRGAQSDTASVTQTENYMAQKTGITF